MFKAASISMAKCLTRKADQGIKPCLFSYFLHVDFVFNGKIIALVRCFMVKVEINFRRMPRVEPRTFTTSHSLEFMSPFGENGCNVTRLER